MKKDSKIYLLSKALNYPEEISQDVVDFVFLADGIRVNATEQSRGIILRVALQCSEELIPLFAQYASGRLLREGATLTWEGDSLWLWQEIPSNAEDDEMCRIFEEFIDSCDWWLSRCAEKEVPQSVLPDILIRP